MVIQNLLGQRIKSLRLKNKITAQELAKKMSYNSHQIILNIESGKRKVSSTELLKLTAIFNVNLEYFSDPYQIIESNCFLWNGKASLLELNNLELKIKKILSIYKKLGDFQKVPINYTSLSLEINKKNTIDYAILVGESLAKEWNLGDYPAQKLIDFIENELKILVLYIDLPKNISSASFKITGLSAIIVNNNSSEEDINFSVAYELFHIMTLDKTEIKAKNINKYLETLANSFVYGLLIPENFLLEEFKLLKHQSAIALFINTHAKKLKINTSVLLNRLKRLELLESFPKRLLNSNNSKLNKNNHLSKTFINRLWISLNNGDLLVEEALSLGYSKSQLKKVFESNNLKIPLGF